jgi:hypothetical protein
MWQALTDHFSRFPAQERVVRLMIRLGLRIDGESVWAGPVEIADTALARAADVDRRIVRATVKTISENATLLGAFSRFEPTLHLREAAPALGAGVLEIVATDAHKPGILAGVSEVIAGHGLSIRQAIVDDPAFTDQPILYVVTEEPIPGELIPLLQNVPGVRTVGVRGFGS